MKIAVMWGKSERRVGVNRDTVEKLSKMCSTGDDIVVGIGLVKNGVDEG